MVTQKLSSITDNYANTQGKRSIGDLFFASYDELQDLRYMDALLLILKTFIDRIKERMLFMEKELDEMLNSFLEKLPLLWHNCLKHCA